MPHLGATRFPTFADLHGRDLAMFEASRAVFERLMDEGHADVPIRDLAAHAGVSERTFYRYFPRKEDAIRPYLRAGLLQIVARLRSASPEQPLALAFAEAHADLLDLALLVDVERFLALLQGTERLRAVWLELVGEAEAAFADVIAGRLGVAASSIQARMASATIVAAGRFALDAARTRQGRPSEVFAAGLAWAAPELFHPPPSREGSRP